MWKGEKARNLNMQRYESILLLAEAKDSNPQKCTSLILFLKACLTRCVAGAMGAIRDDQSISVRILGFAHWQVKASAMWRQCRESVLVLTQYQIPYLPSFPGKWKE
jgi:hypothetical protein